ncbi:M48 family metalloprotease [Candidatus Solincola tengchongensis]|uniref:M48 family metallopeptidase n=1 Tax=Candidatus Solincola tengchongensis TaxID=2900693 RepID=UPI002580FFFD|nr:M48 family metalloprotease [Candidatus Solincola tengchongensis]
MSMQPKDFFSLLQANRRRMFLLFFVFSCLVMGLSSAGVFLVRRLLAARADFWLTLLLFWLLYLLYAILRFALGGRWILNLVAALPPGQVDRRLENALQAALLGTGTDIHVRLLEIPHPDINSFSFALPDGSHALFVTRGVAEKLPEREREAVMAHELAHITSGDTMIQSVLLRLVGPGPSLGRSTSWFTRASYRGLPALLAIPLTALVLTAALNSGRKPSPAFLYPLSLALLFAVLASLMSLLLYRLMRLFLDREREYYADLQASYILRDPEAVYLAVEHASEDVRDIMLLPRNLDAILFHPVVDYASYRPFRTQPTMAERMRRLEECFPALSTGERHPAS